MTIGEPMNDRQALIRDLREAAIVADPAMLLPQYAALFERAATALEEEAQGVPREPVAFMYWNEPDTQRHLTLFREAIGSHWQTIVPLYAAPAAPTREPPVAWIYERADQDRDFPPAVTTQRWVSCRKPWTETPLYAAPTREPTVHESHERILSGRGTPADFARILGDPMQGVSSSPAPTCADQDARRLYATRTANDPHIHCNRFPSWEELDEATKNEYRRLATTEPKR